LARQDDQTPVSYLKRTRISGYLRKDGRIVEPYYRSTWVVEFPVPLTELDLSDFGREKFPIQAAIEPVRAVPDRLPRSSWQGVQDFVVDLYDEYDFFELTDPIAHKVEEADVISQDGFVWDRPLTDRSMDALDLKEIYLIRVWVLLYDRSRDVYFVFARARSLMLRPEASRRDLASAYVEVLDIYDGMVEWAEEHTDYIEVRRMLAWTVWGLPIGAIDPQKAPWTKRV